MVAESGAVLLQPEAKRALVERVLPLAAVVTPNLPEARELTGLGPEAGAAELARAVRALGPRAVVVTGGHTESGADLFFDGEAEEQIEGARHPDGRLARLRLHALLGARRSPRPRHDADRGGSQGAADRLRGGRQRPARRRRGRGPGGRSRPRGAPPGT